MSHDENEAFALLLRRFDRLEAKLDALTPGGAPKFLTIKGAAKAYDCSPDTIRRACDRRELRFVQNGPKAAIRIDVKDLQAWADRRASVRKRGA